MKSDTFYFKVKSKETLEKARLLNCCGNAFCDRKLTTKEVIYIIDNGRITLGSPDEQKVNIMHLELITPKVFPPDFPDKYKAYFLINVTVNKETEDGNPHILSRNIFIRDFMSYYKGYGNSYFYVCSNPTDNCQIQSFQGIEALLMSKLDEKRIFEALTAIVRMVHITNSKKLFLFDIHTEYANKFFTGKPYVVFMTPYISTNTSQMTIGLLNVLKF